jgi:hypothetical protein
MKNAYLFWAAMIILTARCSAQTWSVLPGGSDYIGGQINAMVVYNGQLFAGGQFDSAGNTAASNIAAWNGTAWNGLNGGVMATHWHEPSVQAMAVYNNDLYVGGSFDSLPGSVIDNIARWDGSSWTAILPGVSLVRAMTVYDGDLYVAGVFDSAGSLPASNIAMWNGSAWASVDGGVWGTGAYGLSVYNNKLIVSGNFSSAGSAHLSAVNIASWDGANWGSLGNGIGDTVNSSVVALTAYNNHLIASGTFQSAGSVFAQNIAEWDGSSWAAMGQGLGNGSDTQYVVALAGYNGALIAGGHFLTTGSGATVSNIAQWNGSLWSAMDLGLSADGAVISLCPWNGSLYVGGGFETAGALTAGSIAEWTAPNAINEMSTVDIAVAYPNPVSNKLIVENIDPGCAIYISNLLGQTIIKTRSTGSKEILDVSALAPGMYFVNGMKFIKE